MNRALRIIFSRYGIVVIILVLVLGAIALANDRRQTPLDGMESNSEGTQGERTSEPITEDDGFATEACDGDDCFAVEDLPQEAVDRAVAFTAAWLNPNGYGPTSWHNSIAPYLTAERADLMEGVDPISVPANEIDGEPEAEGTKVAIPMDTGTLTLTMVEGPNAWLVSAIDWEQS